ncbi:hypothetical protein GY45DRAFT_1439596 [Cubamyces sp. BRFM 1775]|nr:hypothetical protein GY45DRAFT_1439596 [Cubamyces sp. BRFM 1775]
MRETGFDDFDGFLGAHPDIASCIRELELKQVPGELDIGFARAAVTPTTLSTLSAKLPRLQVLRLRKMWIFDAFFDSPASARPITQRPRLKALTLHDCTNGSNCALSLRTLHGILETFPADDVSLHYLTIANAPDANTETRWSQLQVRNLTLHHVHAQSPLLDILRQILTPHGLQSLRTRLENTYNLSPEFLRVLSEFLIHVGGSQLRHLELPFTIGSVVDPQEDDPDHWRILQLHTCSELESITFHLHVPLRRSAARTPRTVMTRHGVPVSALLVAFLPHLPPSLRIYTLTSIDAYSPDYVRSQTILHLKRLDNALVARFPMLEKVQIIIRDREWLDDYSQAILQIMGGGNEDASDLERANEVARQIQSRGLDILPPELVDSVFAHTLYDKATISACTLVSRNWRAMCIPHLFSSLTVVRQTDTFADFEHFLDTQKHVASYVQELEIKQLEPPQAAVACDVLAAMCQKLPGLKVLRLRGLWILDPMFDSRAPTSPGMVHLKMKALHLDSCSNGSSGLLSSQTLHAVLDIFPTNSLSLIYLAIANTDSQPLNDDRSSENPPIQRNRVRVATLSLHRVRATSPPPLDVLHQILAPQCLQTFRARWVDVDGGHPEPLRKLGKFLGDVGGAQLRHLEFPVTIGPNVVALEDKPGMHPITGVRFSFTRAAIWNPSRFAFLSLLHAASLSLVNVPINLSGNVYH